MLAGAGLGEESGEGVILRLGSVHCRQSAIRLQRRNIDSHLVSRNYHLNKGLFREYNQPVPLPVLLILLLQNF